MLRWARLRYFARIQTGITIDASRDQGETAEERPYLRVANVQAGRLDLDEVKTVSVPPFLADRATLQPGDVLMTEGGDLDKLGRGTVWRGQVPGCLHQNHIFAVRPHPGRLDSDYLAQFTQTSYARSYFESTGVKTTNLASTSSSKILDLPIPVLPIECQRAIIDFLDRETARIDSLLIAKRRMIVLLQERWQAILDAAILHQGRRIRLRHLVSRLTSGPRGWADYVTDEGILFLRIANLSPDSIELSMNNVTYVDPPSGAELERVCVRSGDVLMSITAEIGSIGVARAAHEGAAVSQHIALMTPSLCSGDWLAWSLSTTPAKAQLEASRYGGTKTQLGLDDIREIAIGVMGSNAEDHLVNSLQRMATVFGRARAKLKEQLGLLEQRRQALITAAVTGEIEIPGAAA